MRDEFYLPETILNPGRNFTEGHCDVNALFAVSIRGANFGIARKLNIRTNTSLFYLFILNLSLIKDIP